MKRKLKTTLNCGKRTKTSQSRGSETLVSQSRGSETLSSQWERWESDSGISSGRSSPVSGRVSPVGGGAQVLDLPLDCVGPASDPAQSSLQTSFTSFDHAWTSPDPSLTSVVSLDCEMVGTGPGGRVSEVARCSLVDYYGRVIFDKYVLPIGPVTDYRSQWSGIRKHHLSQATPFSQARAQVQSLLRGKVLVGHSVQIDLKSLDLIHPSHMIRDTSSSRLLTRLAGLPRTHRPSLKALTNQLLHRKIQVGRCGHSSVEDAVAALDLYKLVEGEWEREVELSLMDERDPAPPSFASSQHYMSDQYWPDVL